MPGYRRFIAYVYEYLQGKKGDGKGFIKVEARNGICRMNFKLEGIPGRDSVKAKAYGYVREGKICRGVLLGQGELAGNQAQFELEMREDHMGDSSYSLSDLGGLLILGENGETYASGWDEQPVRPEMIELPFKKEQEISAPEEEAEAEEELPAEESAPQETAEEREQEEQKISEEEEPYTENMYEEESEETDSIPMAEEQKPETPVAPETEEAEENIRIVDSPEMESQSAAAARNRWTPFGDDEINECRKITPADFRILGRRDRGLMNNNFLRYGMKNYGHLLLGKREEDGRYILGVPGIYERQEGLMANMFGFPYFKDCGKASGRGKRFGYWYRVIDTPQL